MKRIQKITILVFLILLLFLISLTTSYADGKNLVQNPSFEETINGTPTEWSTWNWKNDGKTSSFTHETGAAYTGESFVTIVNKEGNDARFMQTVHVHENSNYRISCSIKTENVGIHGKGANISIEGRLETSRDIKGTNGDWETVELFVKTGQGVDKFVVTIGLGGYGSINTGKASFDEVIVERIDTIPAGVPMALIELDKGENKSGGSSENKGTKTGRSTKNDWLILVGAAVAAALGAYYAYVTRESTHDNNEIYEGDYFPDEGCENKEVGTLEHDIGEKKGTALSTHDSRENKGVVKSVPGNGENKETVISTHGNGYGKLKISKKDLIIMAAMTFAYLIVALINLGSTKVPKTGWMPAKAGESFIIDFGKRADISRIYYYQGHGDGWYIDGKYRIEFRDNNGEFKALGYIEKKDFYKWNYVNVSTITEQLKIIVDEPGGTLLEMGFFETGTNQPLTDFKVIEKHTDLMDEGFVENLFDESYTIEYRPSFMTSTYFDEIYHARTAYEHLNRLEPYENTHPPLGKLFIGIGIALFGMNPFGWRIIGTLFGAAMIPVMYLFGKKLFNSGFYAFCAAFLMMFDFMHFAQTRIATIDVYATFFIILMYYFIYDYFMNKSYDLGFKQSLKPLFYCGLVFGVGVACKWISMYAGAGLALLFFSAKYIEYKEYKLCLGNKKQKSCKWIKDFIPIYIIKTMVYCVLFFVIIPVAIYILSYIPFMMVAGLGHNLRDVWRLQIHMYSYHSGLEATHSFSSPWYQWPFIYKPTWFYRGMDMPQGMVSSIVSMGNPAIWWIGIVTVFVCAYISFKKRDKKMAVVFIALAFQYLPWALVTRITWIYHFFSSVPFVIFTIVYVIKYIMEEYKTRHIVYAYLGIVAVLFIYFYPVLSGMAVPTKYVEGLKWFKSWIF